MRLPNITWEPDWSQSVRCALIVESWLMRDWI